MEGGREGGRDIYIYIYTREGLLDLNLTVGETLTKTVLTPSSSTTTNILPILSPLQDRPI